MPFRRIVVALIFIPLFIVLVRYLPPQVFFILILSAIMLGQYEFYAMLSRNGIKPSKLLGITLGIISVFLFYKGDISTINIFIVIGIFLITVGRLMSKKNIKMAFADISITFFGIFFLAWLMGYQILLRKLDQGSNLILFLYTVIWAGDSAAYLVGSSLGRHKLAPVVSPKKTWEGAIAGLLASLGIALAAKFIFFNTLNYRDCIILGSGLGILGQIGDISESLFKRGAEVKDSSSIIPGHGGILDKIDSFLYTSPALYYYYKYFMIGR